MIDSYKRYQPRLTMEQLFPARNNECACGCGKKLSGKRKRWATPQCQENAYIYFAIIKGDNRIIRQQLFNRDQGFCCQCGVYDEKWQADHITPVKSGGGGSALTNFQTLCFDCHKEKTYSIKCYPSEEQSLHMMQKFAL